LLLNKADLRTVEQLESLKIQWLTRFAFDKTYFISALHHQNTDKLLADIVELMPIHPAFYPKDQLTDRPERFFVSEIVREKILELYHQEIPYSCEVAVHTLKKTKKKISSAFMPTYLLAAKAKKISLSARVAQPSNNSVLLLALLSKPFWTKKYF
jgi:GTP-binding protein Era